MKFLAFTYKVPSEPSKNRVYIWRSIKELGAVYLQQGVALLPYDEGLCDVLKKLKEQVNSFEGKSTISELNFLDEQDEKEILAEFKKQIDEEYIELQENCERYIYMLDRETEIEKFEFSELQENEEEVKKFERWIKKINKRNYFNSENEEKSREMIEKTKVRLQEYSDEVYARDQKR